MPYVQGIYNQKQIHRKSIYKPTARGGTLENIYSGFELGKVCVFSLLSTSWKCLLKLLFSMTATTPSLEILQGRTH